MKRLVIILACMMCVMSMNSQEHLKFYNIPIDGELKNAVKLVKKELGLKGIRIKNIGALMGEIDGEEVMVALIGDPKSKIWCCAFVSYNVAENWDELWQKYQTINATLKVQYGEPEEITEKWEAPYSPTNNPILALQEGKAEIESIYVSEQGFIAAQISGSNSVMVAYMDKINITMLHENEGGFDKILKALENVDAQIDEEE